jgi:hypothetical protein
VQGNLLFDREALKRMEKDQRDLLREFNANNVRFLIVGGYAFSFYTEPRATKDLDIFIDRSPENALRSATSRSMI